MPIEGCFSKVKYFLKEYEGMVQSTCMNDNNINLKLLITAAFTSITSTDCLVWRPAPSLTEEGSGLARINSLSHWNVIISYS